MGILERLTELVNKLIEKLNDLFEAIPNVYDGKLTIKQGNTTLGTFTANQEGDTTVTIAEGGGGSKSLQDIADNVHLDIRWGLASSWENGADWLRITQDNIIVRLLQLRIDNFEDIQDYNPKLIIERYRRKKKVTRKDQQDNRYPAYVKAGWAKDVSGQAVTGERPSEFYIINAYQFLDIKAEKYFKEGVKFPIAKGWKRQTKNKIPIKSGRVRLRFRLELTDKTKPETVLSGSLLEFEIVAVHNGSVKSINYALNV